MTGPKPLATANPWKQTWNSPTQRTQLIIGSISIFTVLGLLPSFFKRIEKRSGIVLHDPILAAIPPHNFSVLIFAIIWGMGLFIMYRVIKTPSMYITYVWSLLFITIVRLVTISLVPLNPPIGIVIISDPLTNLFYGETTVTKDLFFSGHTAMLVLITLCLEKRSDKILGFIATVVVGCLLLVQHIHYTMDVLAAPLFVYPLYRLAVYLLKKKRPSQKGD